MVFKKFYYLQSSKQARSTFILDHIIFFQPYSYFLIHYIYINKKIIIKLSQSDNSKQLHNTNIFRWKQVSHHWNKYTCLSFIMTIIITTMISIKINCFSYAWDVSFRVICLLLYGRVVFLQGRSNSYLVRDTIRRYVLI